MAINDYGQTVGGWGGSFYFWNEKLDGNTSVGQTITASTDELEKFRRTTLAGLMDVGRKHGVSALDDVLSTVNSNSLTAAYYLLPRPENATAEPVGF